MPKAKAATSLAGMIDSEDEQTNADFAVNQDSNQENRDPSTTAKSENKPRATRKTKPTSKRFSGGRTKSTAARRAAKKEPAKTQTKEEEAEQTDEADELESSPIAVEKQAPVIAPKAAQKPAPKRKGRPAKKNAEPPKEEEAPSVLTLEDSVLRDGEFEYTPTRVYQARKAASKTKKPTSKKAQASTEPALLAPPPASNIADISMESIEDEIDDHIDLDPPAEEQLPTKPLTSRARSTSRQPGPRPVHTTTTSTIPRKRGASASSIDNTTTEPNLRRKIGDLTSKYQTLETRYKELRDIGVKEAEENFQRLKRSTDDRARIANDLIASLKKELAAQRAVADEVRGQLPALDAARAENEQLREKLREANTELGDVMAENKALQARLVASRTAAVAAPGSAVKNGKGNGGAAAGGRIIVGSGEAAQVAQLKEELYGDLTGLIIRGVEKEGESEVYDCIQTGRNGSMFLSIPILRSSSHFVLCRSPPLPWLEYTLFFF